MTGLRARLEEFDGKAVSLLAEAQAACRCERGFMSELVGLISGSELNVSAGASWILKDELENGATLGADDVAQLLDGLDRVEAWQAQLHLCQCLEYVDISEGEALDISAWAYGYEAADRPFLRAWSLHLRVVLSRRFAALESDGAAALVAGEADTAASVRARVRHLRR